MHSLPSELAPLREFLGYALYVRCYTLGPKGGRVFGSGFPVRNESVVFPGTLTLLSLAAPQYLVSLSLKQQLKNHAQYFLEEGATV